MPDKQEIDVLILHKQSYIRSIITTIRNGTKKMGSLAMGAEISIILWQICNLYTLELTE
jgi:hypothetical protein